MLYIASKYNAKGYGQEAMMDSDDCYHLSGEDGRRIKDQICDFMEEIDSIGRIAFYEKYKEYKLF